MHDILQFHKLHGSAIVLSENGSLATRSGDFCNGIVFSAQPLKIGQKVCVELSQGSEYSGALRLGVTFHDPSKLGSNDLPRYACPDLTNKEGFWARGIQESYAEAGNRLTFYVNASGQLHYFINNEHKGMLLNHLPSSKRLWALFDIYGNTSAARLVHADEAPVEIVARGSAALKAYQLACESGTQPVFRTRLMLVGQDGVGKTSLKKALTGQSFHDDEAPTQGIDTSVWCSFDPSTPRRTPSCSLRGSFRQSFRSHNRQEESTDGIDLSGSCSFNLRDRRAWKLARDGIRTPIGASNESVDQLSSINHLCSLETLEEEYHRAIANNIVQELLYQRKLQKSGSPENGRESERKSASSSGSRKLKHSLFSGKRKEARSDSAGIGNEDFKMTSESLKSVDGILQEMPERVADLVDELLCEKDSPSTNQQTGNSGANIILNIWDFAGQSAYYTTHQVFLSSRALYIIVFNLCHDFSSFVTSLSDQNEELSHLDYMDLWMHSIHAHSAKNTRGSVDNTTLSPPIFIVGTHRNSVHEDPVMRDKIIEDKLEQIQSMIKGKPYERHIVSQIYSVENSLDDGDDSQIALLRKHIEEVASKEIYMGEQIPLKWLRLEQAMTQLVENKTYFSSLDQITEVAKSVGLTDPNELKTVLEFYHDLGVVVYYGGAGRLDTTLANTVILQTQWLIDMFNRVIPAHDSEQQGGSHKELWHRLYQLGLLDERLIDHVWADVPHQKSALLALMQKFDILSERFPLKSMSTRLGDRLDKAFYVPSCVRRVFQSDDSQTFTAQSSDALFYMDFNGFLPDGLYHRVVTRAVRWSQECGGHEPLISFRQARFFLDSEHDFILQMSHPSLAHIKVSITRVVDLDQSDGDSSDSSTQKHLLSPKPNSCAKVRNFLESSLADLRELWMKRISYQAVVPCVCDQVCSVHSVSRCRIESCMHFLSLDQCLANKVVCCGYRRIKTSIYRKWFPCTPPVVKTGPVLSDQLVKTVEDNSKRGNIEASTQGVDMPSWCRSAAKLLNGGAEGQDWAALALKLGYKKNRVDKLGDDMNPGLALITDWIISCGNTPLSVDMILSCLEQLHRDDIVEIIRKAQESEDEAKQVFISYQWDSQDEVSLLRDRLEKAGFTCWMDIGQMGGGDHLYARIDEGIRKAKVVLACITPKYVVSHHCHKEISLADLLRKPIIPVMYEKITWPPHGAMALVFASLCYVDMKGVGGHGGAGIHADMEHRYQEILQRTANFATPMIQADPQSEKVPLTTESFPLETSVHSGESLNSYSPQREPLLIPGYASDNSSSMRSSMPMQPISVNPTPSSVAGPSALGGVEQVHVTKCAVCTIL